MKMFAVLLSPTWYFPLVVSEVLFGLIVFLYLSSHALAIEKPQISSHNPIISLSNFTARPSLSISTERIANKIALFHPPQWQKLLHLFGHPQPAHC